MVELVEKLVKNDQNSIKIQIQAYKYIIKVKFGKNKNQL